MKKLLTNALLLAMSVTLLTASCAKDPETDPIATPGPTNPGTTGTIVYRLSGVAVNGSYVTASYLNNTTLEITGSATPKSLNISLANPTTSGTISNGTIQYSVGGARWIASPGTNSVNISSFDTVNRKVSGTFTATLAPVAGTSASGSQTITDGSFSNVSF